MRDYLLAPDTPWTPDDRPSIWDILRRYEAVCPRAALLGNSRCQDVVAIRHRAMRECHDAGHSLTAIGRAFGRDHTTVRAAVLKADQPTRRAA